MLACDVNDLGRYALAFIKKSGSTNKIQYFLAFVFNSQQNWSKAYFDELYEQFIAQQARQPRQSNTQNFQPYAGPQANTGHQQNIRIEHVQVNTHSDFWDCLLLQCWLNSLFSGHGRTTVNNITNINYGNNTTNHTNKKKEADDGRKLLAAGIAVVVVVAIFHISMCYWYQNSKKTARESSKMDYLDNRLKTLRNIEFLGAFVSLAGLIACVVYPVLPTWGLIALGVHSLVCFMGGLAFHMKHERESEYIELAKKAADSYLTALASNPGFNPNTFAHNNSAPPPPYPGLHPTDNNPRPTAPEFDPNDLLPPYSPPGQTAFYFGSFNNVDVQGGRQQKSC